MPPKRKGMVWVPRFRRRLKRGRPKRVSGGGYWRKKRPKGKRKIVTKEIVRLRVVRDEVGRFHGYRAIKK